MGGTVDGALQQYGLFGEYDLVSMPENLNFLEGASLCCAGVTAWNALYGVTGRMLMPGDWVLTQGTGGVSIFALQVRTDSNLFWRTYSEILTKILI